MLVFEPYISMGNKTRSDALAYFFSTLCFFFFLRKNYTIAGIFGMLGLETHPMGISGFFYCLAYFIWQHRSYLSDKKTLMKSLVLFFLGITVGIAIYLSLHYKTLLNIGGELNHFSGTGASSNYLFKYFFQSKLQRNLPEFLIFSGITVIYFVKKLYKTEKFSIIFLITLLCQSFLLPRGNANYAVFAFPALLLLLVQVSFYLKKTNLMLILVLLLLLPQYIYLYKMNYREHSHTEYIEEISQMIPDDSR